MGSNQAKFSPCGSIKGVMPWFPSIVGSTTVGSMTFNCGDRTGPLKLEEDFSRYAAESVEAHALREGIPKNSVL